MVMTMAMIAKTDIVMMKAVVFYMKAKYAVDM